MLNPVGKFATNRIKAWLEDYATLVGSVDFSWRSGSLTIPQLVLKVRPATGRTCVRAAGLWPPMR